MDSPSRASAPRPPDDRPATDDRRSTVREHVRACRKSDLPSACPVFHTLHHGLLPKTHTCRSGFFPATLRPLWEHKRRRSLYGISCSLSKTASNSCCCISSPSSSGDSSSPRPLLDRCSCNSASAKRVMTSSLRPPALRPRLRSWTYGTAT